MDKLNKKVENPILNLFGGVNRRLAKVQFKQTHEQLGRIEAVLVVDRVLYAIIRRTQGEWDEINHESFPLFNNFLHVDDEFLSPTELLIPITNVDLSQGSIQPNDMIGQYATVSVVDNQRAVKAEYIGGVDDPEQGPFKLLQNVLYNARMLAGTTAKLTEEGSKAKEYLSKIENLNETNLAWIGMSFDDWKGKVVTLSNDAVYHKTTDAAEEFELKVEQENFFKKANNTKMKTKNCHLPVTIFTAR